MDTIAPKHTPTQWRLNRGSKRFYLTEPVAGGGENQVAEIVTGDAGVARLIAAAPDLLSALRVSTAFLQIEAASHRQRGDKVKAESCERQVNLNLDTINRAEGR